MREAAVVNLRSSFRRSAPKWLQRRSMSITRMVLNIYSLCSPLRREAALS